MSILPPVSFLLVDDQPSSLDVLTLALMPLPVALVTASSGEEAIAAVEGQEFALIFLDVKMPGIDGFETAQRIRRLPHGQKTPIIFVTAHAIQPEEVLQGYDTGAIDYLLKPINAPILLSKARLYLEFFQQKQLLQHRSVHLENLVEANTLSLVRTNQTLQRELHHRRQLEQVLKILTDPHFSLPLGEWVEAIATELSRLPGLEGVWFWEMVDSTAPLHVFARHGQSSRILPRWMGAFLEPITEPTIQPLATPLEDSPLPQEIWVAHSLLASSNSHPWNGQWGFMASSAFGDRRLMEEILTITGERLTLQITHSLNQSACTELQSLHQVILASISDAVFLTTASGNLTFICPNVSHIFGYSREEVRDLGTIHGLLGPLTLDETRLADTGELVNLPHTIQDRDGRPHHLLINIKRVNLPQGAYLYSCRDVSDRVAMEQQLQANEENFRNVATYISDGLLILDGEHRICFVNRSAEQLFCRPAEMLIGQDWDMGPLAERNELDIPQPDHTCRTVDAAATAIAWYGEPATLISLRDITDRKAMELQLRRDERKYYSLLENIHSGVIVHGADTRILYANPTARTFLGLDNLEGRGAEDRTWQFFRGDGESLSYEDFPVNQVLRRRSPVVNFEMGILRQRDQAICWALINAYPEWDEQGDILQVVVTFTDITERKQMEMGLKTLNESLEQIVEERTNALEATNAQLIQEIEEKAAVAQVLDRQEAKYRALVRDASDAIIVTTIDLTILEVNERAIHLSGYNERDLIGQSLLTLNLFPGQLDRPHKAFWRTLRFEQMAQLSDVLLQRRSGDSISIDIAARVITYDDQAIIQFMVHDITLQKVIQTQLAQENEFRRQVIDHMVEGLCICHEISAFPFVEFTIWNPMMERITGYSHTEINQGGWYQQLYPDLDYQRQAIARMQAMRHGQPILGEEWQITRKDGQVRTIQISTTLLRDSANQDNVLALIQDITDQKHQMQLIEEKEATLRCIIENLPIFFGMRTYDYSKWLYINSAFKTLTGYDPQEMYDDPLLWQKFYHPEDLPRARQMLDGEFPQGESSDFRMVRKDGQEIWARVVGYVVDEPSPNARVVSFGQDITELKQAEADMQKSLAKERELNQVKSQFVDIVSHEFRTPLTAILGFSELLIRHFERLSDEKKRHYIANIQNASQRLSQLIDDVLSISRYDANKLEVSLGITRLANLGQEIIEAFQAGLGSDHQLQFIYGAESDGDALLDGRLLRHILDNLISNAIKYSPPGSRVTLAIAREDHYWRFTVQDEGIGIPEADQANLFEPFHRASNVGETPGTGLGLSIVKRYVEFQGGEITFESNRGQGTRFVVRLPIARGGGLEG